MSMHDRIIARIHSGARRGGGETVRAVAITTTTTTTKTAG